MTKFIALVQIRGARGQIPINLDAGEHKNATAALLALARRCRAWFAGADVETIIVCPAEDQHKFLSFFRGTKQPN